MLLQLDDLSGYRTAAAAAPSTVVGATLGSGFMLNLVKEALSEALVVPLYCEHVKDTMTLSVPYLTLDWVSRWRAGSRPDVISVLEDLKRKAPPAKYAYYDHTIDFVRYVELDPLEARAVFLRATTYRVKNLAKVRLDILGSGHPVVLKVKGETPHCGHILNLPKEVLQASAELSKLFDRNILFVKRLDYPKFLASLPTEAGVAFDLAASGVVMQVAKQHVEYLDVFNYDPKEQAAESMMNFEVIR